MPRQHLPFPHGGIYYEGFSGKSGTGRGVSDCLRRHQHGGVRKSHLSAGKAEAAGARDFIGGAPGPPDGAQGLSGL